MPTITKIPGFIVDEISDFTFANANITGNLLASNANLGNTVTANFITGTLTTNSQPNITSVGTLGNLTVTSNASIGNVKTDNLLYSNGNPWNFASSPAGSNTEIQFNNAGSFGSSANLIFNASTKTLTVDKISANGAGLSSLSGANVSGAVANATYAVDAGTAQTAISVAGANVTGQVNNSAIAGTVYTNAQPNITSVGNLTSLTVTGTANLGNVSNVKISGGTSTQILSTDGSGNLSWVSQTSLTGYATETYVGNAIANLVNSAPAVLDTLGEIANALGSDANFSTTITNQLANKFNTSDFTSNANTAIDNRVTKSFVDNLGVVANIANTANSVSGSNVSGQVGNALVAGTVYTNAQPNITSVGTLTSLDVTGNVSANFFIGNGSQLTGLPASYTDANVANYLPNYTGSLSGNVANIVTLNISGTSNLGNIGNVKITGGSNGYLLTTDGNGNLSWSNSAVTSIGDTYFDSFVANGNQTAFTLSVTPDAKKYVSVFIDSTYQNDDIYTIAGNVITFSLAPFVDSVIEIRTLKPGTVNSASTAATVTTNAQPNITSVGTLSNLTMAGNIIPATSNTYTLGNATNRFKDLYLEGNTIYLGNTTLSADDVLPFNLTISPEVLTINANGSGPGNDIHWLWTWNQSTLPYARTTIVNQQQIQVPLYKQGTYQVNNFANEQHGNLDQRHMLWLKWVDGAGLDNLVSWAVNAGNVTHSHPSINNGANTVVQRLNITVPSTVTIPTLNLPSNVTYNVAANGSSAFSISGSGIGENRNIGPLYRGATYTFNLDSSLANHPFYITTDNGTGFVANTYVGEYLTGITGSRGNGAPGANVLSFTVANNAPDVLFYQCGHHSAMRGAITIRNLEVETNINGNPVLYFQHGREGHKTPVEIRPIPALVNQMCLVYDATTNQFVPQDMATYVENTPSFKNKIQEVAGTATLVAPDGVAVVPTVLTVEDVSYLPLVDNNDGDIAFDQYTNTVYVWSNGAWRNTKPTSYANLTLSGNTTVSGNLIVAGKTVPTTKTFTLVQTGNITVPYTGTARCYPTGNVTISNVYASLGTASSTSFTFTIKKNGSAVGNYTINSNSYRLTSQAANISLTASDYLTLDITAGTGASDLKVDLEYSV